MTISQANLKALKAEEKRIKANASQRAMRRDAREVMPKKTKTRLPDTPKVIAERLRIKLWAESHKDAIKAIQKRHHEKKASEAKVRMAQAIAQAEATQRNVSNLLAEIEDSQ